MPPSPGQVPLQVVHSCSTWLAQTETWLHTEVVRLPASDVTPFVVCERTANLDQFPVENLYCLGGPTTWRFWRDKVPTKFGMRRHSQFLVETARAVKADLVHSHFGPYGWRDVPAVRRLGAKHVVSFYGYDVGKLPSTRPVWRNRYGQLFAAVDAVLCEGPFMARSIQNLGCPPQKIRVHHLGILLDKIHFRPRRWEPHSALRILLAATFTPKKGLPDALAALAIVKDRLPLQITIIGDARNDPTQLREKDLILKAVKQTNLAEVTTFLGFQTHARLIDEAYRHHIFISPSMTAADGDSEGGAPITILEMAASGISVISTQHCDIPEVLGPPGLFLLAVERDITGIADRILWLAENYGQWDKFTTGVRKHIEREYDADTQAGKLATLYELLCKDVH